MAATFTNIYLNKDTIKLKSEWRFLIWIILKCFFKKFNIIYIMKIFIANWFEN